MLAYLVIDYYGLTIFHNVDLRLLMRMRYIYIYLVIVSKIFIFLMFLRLLSLSGEKTGGEA